MILVDGSHCAVLCPHIDELSRTGGEPKFLACLAYLLAREFVGQLCEEAIVALRAVAIVLSFRVELLIAIAPAVEELSQSVIGHEVVDANATFLVQWQQLFIAVFELIEVVTEGSHAEGCCRRTAIESLDGFTLRFFSLFLLLVAPLQFMLSSLSVYQRESN